MHSEYIIFWFAVGLLGYIYIGYPVLLCCWAKLHQHKSRNANLNTDHAVSTVTILVVAYNEERRIKKRIDNLLALDYPRERLQIIIASDGSSDNTAAYARNFRSAGVVVIEFRRRRGKSAVLNELIPLCKGDIVLLADARQQFERNVLRMLTDRFADVEVGAVSGELILIDGPDDSGTGEGVGFYWRYEKFIRYYESRIDSMVGVTGAIYAIRRHLFEPIPEDIILDDVLIPMNIVRKGYRVVFESGAHAYDRVATAETEFIRKVRTLAGNFQLFFREPWLWNPLSNRLWIQTISHKVCRLLSPLCLMAAFGANLFLLNEWFYRATFITQIILYFSAVAGFIMRNSRRNIRLFNILHAFCLLNWAVIIGFFRFVSGRQRVTWETAAMSQVRAGKQAATSVRGQSSELPQHIKIFEYARESYPEYLLEEREFESHHPLLRKRSAPEQRHPSGK